MFETAPEGSGAVFHSQKTMPYRATDYLAIPEARRLAIAEIARELTPGRRVALSTHMNADGDGCQQASEQYRDVPNRYGTAHVHPSSKAF